MSRSTIALRDARTDDAPLLAELWARGLRRADHEDQVADLERLIDRADPSTTRVVVAECDGEPAGALLVWVAPVSPINPELAVHLLGPQVFSPVRRRGVGRVLMEIAVAFADDSGVGFLSAAAGAGASSRDGNRFLARLAFAPHASLRLAPVSAVRARLASQRPSLATTGRGGTQVSRVLAARRSMRRSQSSAT